MANVVEHALAKHHLTVVRSQTTQSAEFRHSLRQLSMFAAIQATAQLPLTNVSIETPVQATSGSRVYSAIALVPILRAGVIMVDPVLDLIPDAQVWHLGLYRDEETAQPVSYYNKLPAGRAVETALVLDPMLATGGSACMALQAMKDWGVKKASLVSVIAAPEGIERVKTEYPDTSVFTCSIDSHLNDKKFIVPGLGDAGDRVFNTN